jgi:hypothetical protein
VVSTARAQEMIWSTSVFPVGIRDQFPRRPASGCHPAHCTGFPLSPRRGQRCHARRSPTNAPGRPASGSADCPSRRRHRGCLCRLPPIPSAHLLKPATSPRALPAVSAARPAPPKTWPRSGSVRPVGCPVGVRQQNRSVMAMSVNELSAGTAESLSSASALQDHGRAAGSGGDRKHLSALTSGCCVLITCW